MGETAVAKDIERSQKHYWNQKSGTYGHGTKIIGGTDTTKSETHYGHEQVRSSADMVTKHKGFTDMRAETEASRRVQNQTRHGH